MIDNSFLTVICFAQSLASAYKLQVLQKIVLQSIALGINTYIHGWLDLRIIRNILGETNY